MVNLQIVITIESVHDNEWKYYGQLNGHYVFDQNTQFLKNQKMQRINSGSMSREKFFQLHAAQRQLIVHGLNNC